MIIFLIAGIACLALCAFQVTRPRLAADRERRTALEAVRSPPRRRRGPPDGSRRESVLLPSPVRAARAPPSEDLEQGFAR